MLKYLHFLSFLLVLMFIIFKKSIPNFAFQYSSQLLLMPVPFFVTHLLVVCVVQLAFVGLVAILFYYMHFSSTKWRQTSPHGPVQGLSIALGWILRRVCRGGTSLWLRLFGAMFLCCCLWVLQLFLLRASFEFYERLYFLAAISTLAF